MLSFSDFYPKDKFLGLKMKIVTPEEIDGDSITKGSTTFLDQISGGWTYPFATGRKYEISWGQGEKTVDFTHFMMKTSNKWLDTDKSILFTHNYTEERAEIFINVNGVPIKNNSIASEEIDNEFLELGQNKHLPDDNEFQFIANGIVSHHNLKTDGQRTMIVNGY